MKNGLHLSKSLILLNTGAILTTITFLEKTIKYYYKGTLYYILNQIFSFIIGTTFSILMAIYVFLRATNEIQPSDSDKPSAKKNKIIPDSDLLRLIFYFSLGGMTFFILGLISATYALLQIQLTVK